MGQECEGWSGLSKSAWVSGGEDKWKRERKEVRECEDMGFGWSQWQDSKAGLRRAPSQTTLALLNKEKMTNWKDLTTEEGSQRSPGRPVGECLLPAYEVVPASGPY